MIELLLEADRVFKVGLLDRAEALYRQIADADPRNAMAVVGLARVTLERGDEHGTLEFARHALSIDPENDAARRIAARMTEVLATRGELVDSAAAVGPRPSGVLAADRSSLPAAGAPSGVDEITTTSEAPVVPDIEVRVRAPRSLLDRMLRRR
jgi:thioredoxin-like negative regulator of GroEL